MATHNTTIAPDLTSDATFRTMVAAIRDSLDAVATRTADTGQIDTATATRSASSNTPSGYNMWTLNDGLSAVYFKLEYGRGSSITIPSLWATFGTVTDGAGTLSGATTARRQFVITASTTAFSCLFSGGANRFAIMLFDNHTDIQSRLTFGLERDHAVDGSDDDDYYFAVYAQGSNSSAVTCHNRCVKVSGDQWREHSAFAVAWPTGSTGVLGLDVAGWPLRPIYGTERNPSRNFHFVMAADVAAGTIFDAAIYGETQTWVRTQQEPNNDFTYALCMRWE